MVCVNVLRGQPGTFVQVPLSCVPPMTSHGSAGLTAMFSNRIVVLRFLFTTLQFENVAINPALPCEVMGGTQDNGTWTNVPGCPRNTFTQTIYGDGGNAGYDGTQPTWRFNEFTSGFSDSNFRNGDPQKWVISSA